MRRSVQLSLMLLSLASLAAMPGCETAAPRQQLDWKRMTLTDLSQVAGKWEGLLRRIPPVRTDPVTVMIASDGRFRFTGVKTPGLLSGDGNITVAEGQLTATTEKESATLTLYEADNQRMITVKGQSTYGLEFEANLTPDRVDLAAHRRVHRQDLRARRDANAGCRSLCGAQFLGVSPLKF